MRTSILAALMCCVMAVAGLNPAIAISEQTPAKTMAPTDLPGDSLYQIPVELQTSEGNTLAMAALRGHPLLVAMFYSHCTSVCPLLVAQLQNMDKKLTPQQRAQFRVLLISLDAKRDHAQELRTFRAQHHIEDARWIVARCSPNDVRLLASALGVRYRELIDGSFNHAAVVSAADRDGVVRAQVIGAQAISPEFLTVLRSLSEAVTTNLQTDGSLPPPQSVQR